MICLYALMIDFWNDRENDGGDEEKRWENILLLWNGGIIKLPAFHFLPLLKPNSRKCKVTRCDSRRKSKQIQVQELVMRVRNRECIPSCKESDWKEMVNGSRHLLFFYYFPVLNPKGSLAVVIRRGVEFKSLKHG